MKRVANSYSARTRSAQTVAVRSRAMSAMTVSTHSSAGTRAVNQAKVGTWILQIPNYVWLAMIVLAFTGLSLSTYLRAQGIEQEALQSHSVVTSRVENVKATNKQIKQQTAQIKNNPHVAEQAAQQQQRVLRANEIVVARP